MPLIKFITADGAAHDVVCPPGLSLMQAAVHGEVPGIVAECGGCAACGTCQVTIDTGWADRVPPANALEASVLAESENDHLNLRLSCQIVVVQDLDGMVVSVATRQG